MDTSGTGDMLLKVGKGRLYFLAAIYGLDYALLRKYALLHIAYTSFMLALIFGVASSISVYLKVV
ncbi:MAG: hypothetical protein ACFHX7_24875 [Pseudomonadota bacterium]